MNRRRGFSLARVVGSIYRALLWLYPPSLRREYGDEMWLLFRDSMREEVFRHGPPGALVALAAALGDLAVTLPREWPRELGQLRRWRRRRAHRRLFGAPAGGTFSVSYGPGRRRRFSEPRRGMQNNFAKFTERARKVMSLSQEEAQRFNHNHIGTEHILLGLVREGDGVAAKVLSNLGVELQQVRSAVEFIIGRGDRFVRGEIGLTPRAKKVIELAIDEARRLNHQYIGTEHLLLGVIREGEGIASGVLASLGVNLDMVRSETISVLNSKGHASRAWASSPLSSSEASQPHPRVDMGQFTAPARKVIGNTFLHARERGEEDITTGHLLMALLDEPDGMAVRTLELTGLSRDVARADALRALGPTLPSELQAHGPVRMDAHTLRVIALAADEARDMGDVSVGPEHLLLAIAREEAGSGAQLMRQWALSQAQLRDASRRAQVESPEMRSRGPLVAQITLICRDVAATEAFYVGRFGAESVAGAATDARTLRLPGGGPLLALCGGATETSGDAIELTLQVGDVDLLWRTLQDDHIADVSVIADGPQGHSFTVRDPDGRLLRVTAGG